MLFLFLFTGQKKVRTGLKHVEPPKIFFFVIFAILSTTFKQKEPWHKESREEKFPSWSNGRVLYIVQQPCIRSLLTGPRPCIRSAEPWAKAAYHVQSFPSSAPSYADQLPLAFCLARISIRMDVQKSRQSGINNSMK